MSALLGTDDRDAFAHLADAKYDAMRKLTYLTLDVESFGKAKAQIELFDTAVDGYKVGLQLFHADGPRVLEHLHKLGKRVFLDVKLHDIPNTVAGALTAICDMDIEMVNIHASGGRKMMEAARNAVDRARHQPLLIAVTVLTSLGEDDIAEVGFTQSTARLVEHLTKLAQASGMSGVVASALDIRAIRALAPSDFEIVVPGTRPLGASQNDQARSLTPTEAVQAGASRLVIGRAVTHSDRPLVALQQIWDDIQKTGA